MKTLSFFHMLISYEFLISIPKYHIKHVKLLHELIRHADKAMYEAKNQGKNQYHFHN
ncbi:diguanylate cyclase [Pontibacillus sp. HMF3514]|nr:diguanylate cyclase [Pontibacillus sp. HMF3514]